MRTFARVILWTVRFWPQWAKRELIKQTAQLEFGDDWRFELIKRGVKL